jgi:hypothetical protein
MRRVRLFAPFDQIRTGLNLLADHGRRRGS